MRVQRQATHAMWQVQAIRSANVRANAIVLNSAVSAYARNRPPLRTPARQCRVSCNAGAFRPPRSPTASSRVQTLRRILALAPSAERPGRHGGSLAAGDELRPALLTKLVKLYGSYAALDGARRRPSATRLTPTPSDAYPCTLAPWCSVRTTLSACVVVRSPCVRSRKRFLGWKGRV